MSEPHGQAIPKRSRAGEENEVEGDYEEDSLVGENLGISDEEEETEHEEASTDEYDPKKDDLNSSDSETEECLEQGHYFERVLASASVTECWS